MRTSSSINGGVRLYVSILPALFPAFVFMLIAGTPYRLTSNSGKSEISSVVVKVKQIYTSQIGIREKLPNSGKAVEQYLRYVNLPKGNPWCAAFVCWVLGKAGVENPRSGWSPELFGEDKIIWSREQRTKSKEQGFPPDVEREPRTKSQESRCPQSALYAYASGSVAQNRISAAPKRFSHPSSLATCLPDRQADNGRPDSYRVATRCAQLKPHPQKYSSPNTGDVFGLYFPEKKRIAHAGFIDQWDGTWMISVEGNTNVSGSREGDGVYRKRRLVRSIYKVARYVNEKPKSLP